MDTVRRGAFALVSLQLQVSDLIALRLDDVGACSKRYEVYSDRSWGWKALRVSANWLFLKYLPPFKKWGPYREMTMQEWYAIYDLLEKYGAKLTVAVTAAWAESEERLIPFPLRFPEEAAALKEGLEQGLIEIANHGLTHCVLKSNAFKPQWFSSNRRYHREFWDWIPLEEQEEHIRRSQDILQTYFQTEVITFVPPGNVFTEATLEIAERYGLWYVSCNTPRRLLSQMVILGDEQVLPFHDREIVLYGVDWLHQMLEENGSKRFRFVRELGEAVLLQAEAKQPA